MVPQLNLKPQDLRWATWRNIPPEPCPTAPAFDIDAACDKLATIKGKYDWSWAGLKLSPVMSRPEAHFWMTAMSRSSQTWNLDRKKFAEELRKRKRDFDGVLTPQQVRELFNNIQAYRYQEEHIIPLFNLTSLSEFVTFFSNVAYYYYNVHTGYSFIYGFRQYILPYLTDDERREIRLHLKPFINPPTWNNSGFLQLAAVIGGFDAEIETILNMKQQYGGYNYLLVNLAFGLSDPKQVEAEIRRMDMPLNGIEQATAWLAHTELTALDWLVTSVIKHQDKATAQSTFRIFKSLEVPEVVPHVLELWHHKESQVKPEALAWLADHPELVANALTPMALGNQRHTHLAQHYLRRMKTMGQEAALQSVCASLDAAAQERFRELVLDYVSDEVPEHTAETTPEWLGVATKTLLADKRKSKVLWVDTLSLPPLTVAGRRLSQEQLLAFLVALYSKEIPMFGDNTTILQKMREQTSQVERDEFTWALYQMWLEMGAPSKEKWAFEALGKMGGDAIVLRLTPLIRKWPGESLHHRAVAGIEILRSIGTDTAIMQINGIAQKVQYAGLKKKAKSAIQDIATARNLTQGELEDRIIPDCGLDENGQRVFDYGRRQFTFVLTGDMKPMVRDGEGKLKATLPKPGKTDDETLASQSQADWNLIKKQIKEVAKIQAARLEAAMVSQRRWKYSDFEQFYLKHPLMTHIICLLIWGGYDAQGQMITTLRVSEDRELVDYDDEPIALDSITQVGIVHPMEMDTAIRQQWGEVFSDYEIIPPFEQLGRAVSILEPDKVNETEITRFAAAKVEAVVMVSILEKSGWMRGAAMDAGIYYSHARYYPYANVTAVVTYDGVAVGGYDWQSEQSIQSCYFVKGEQNAVGYNKHNEKLALGTVPPVVYSETMRTLHAIAGKAVK
jgi:hypothetical protein